MSLVDFDEVHALSELYAGRLVDDATATEAEDEVEDLLLMAWALGEEEFYDMTGERAMFDSGYVRNVLDDDIAGKTYRDRIREYVETGDQDAIKRVNDTEFHRIFETAKYDSALRVDTNVGKRWSTMLDDRVRDTHDYLEGVVVPLDAKFYTYDGDSALYPGGFSTAENNCGCRCVLEYIKN